MRKAVVPIIVVVIIAIIGGIFWYKYSPEPEAMIVTPRHEVLGTSVQGRNIEAFIYGTGTTTLLFVGGIHGGYEKNSVTLAYTFNDYLKDNPTVIPENISVVIIPSANPDGVARGTSIPEARFNANKVDLNRNFDCNWQPESMWRGNKVSAGTAPFSEPEARAIRDFVLKTKPSAVVFWHSQANAVYASQCNNGILPETLRIMDAYSIASGYKAVKVFDSYVVTGASEDWLASIGIPALTVELATHEAVEWDKNLPGVKALIKYFSEK